MKIRKTHAGTYTTQIAIRDTNGKRPCLSTRRRTASTSNPKRSGLVLACMGLRRGEICGVTVADLIREKGCAWDGSPTSLTDSFPRLLEKLEITPHFRLHDCRHFFASYCHDVLKLSDSQIMKLGGWKTDHVMKRVYITAITDETAYVQKSFSGFLPGE